MSAGTSASPQRVSIVDTVLRLDSHADPAVVAAVAAQLASDPSRLAALQADLSAQPEYLTKGSIRSCQVTQEFAGALFAVGVHGVALPRCEWCGSTSQMVARLSTNGGAAWGRCARRMATSRCSRCAFASGRARPCLAGPAARRPSRRRSKGQRRVQ